MLYTDWRDVPQATWRWANFSPRELACKGTGAIRVDSDALDKLQALRELLGRPLLVTSAYRSPSHNKRVRGAKRSLHMRGIAFDIRMENHDPQEFEAAARKVGFTGFGYYRKSGFMHIDTGLPRSWGKPWPETATALAAEPVRQPETLAEDREAQAAAGAGIAGTTAAAVEHLPVVGAVLGDLAPTAQLAALAVAAVLICYILYRRGSE